MNITWQIINKSIKINNKSEFSSVIRINDIYSTYNKIIANAFNSNVSTLVEEWLNK